MPRHVIIPSVLLICIVSVAGADRSNVGTVVATFQTPQSGSLVVAGGSASTSALSPVEVRVSGSSRLSGGILPRTYAALSGNPTAFRNPLPNRSPDPSAGVTPANPCSIDSLIWVSSGGCYTTISAAITAATNGGITAGTVMVPPGNYIISSTLALGSETAPVSMYLMDGAMLTCTMTNGTDCIEIPSHALLRGANWGHGSAAAPSGVYCGPSADLTSLVTNMTHTGSGDLLGGLQNIFLSCTASNAVVTEGVLWWQLVSNNWADENVSIASSASAPARLWNNPATSYASYIGPLYVENPEVNCMAPGCVPFEATGYVSPMLVAGGDINYHPGSAASGNVVVLTTNGSASAGPYGVTFMGTHFEAQTGGDFFYLNGVGDVDFHEVWLNSVNSATAENCLHILNAAGAVGAPGPVKFSGHMVAATCTNAVSNASTGGVIAASSLYQGDIDYVYGGRGSGTNTLFVDGQLACLEASGCVVNASTVVKKGSGGGDYTTNSASFEQVDATNLLYTATVPAGTKIRITAVSTASVKVAGHYCTVGIGIDGTVVSAQQFQSIGLPAQGVVTVNWVFVGDGNSHTFDLRFESDSGFNVASIINGSTVFPTMVFESYPSN
jgi:hypothetical protein